MVPNDQWGFHVKYIDCLIVSLVFRQGVVWYTFMVGESTHIYRHSIHYPRLAFQPRARGGPSREVQDHTVTMTRRPSIAYLVL